MPHIQAAALWARTGPLTSLGAGIVRQPHAAILPTGLMLRTSFVETGMALCDVSVASAVVETQLLPQLSNHSLPKMRCHRLPQIGSERLRGTRGNHDVQGAR